MVEEINSLSFYTKFHTILFERDRYVKRFTEMKEELDKINEEIEAMNKELGSMLWIAREKGYKLSYEERMSV